MSEARLDVTGNSDEAKKAIDKLTVSMAKLREQNRQLKEQSKKHTDEAVGGQLQLLNSMAKTAAGVTSLGVIVGTVYANWQARAEKLKGIHSEVAAQISRVLAESGRLDQGPAMEKWTKGLQAQGITREQATQAFEGVSKAGELTAEQQRGVAGEAAKFGKTGMDLRAFGGLMADLKKAAPEMSDEDIADTAMGMKRTLGDKANQFSADAWQKQIGRLKEGGMSGKDAIDYAIAGLGRDEKGMALGLVEKKLSRQPMSAEERKEMKRVFDPDAIKGFGAVTEADRTSNFAAQQLAALGGAQTSKAVATAKTDMRAATVGPALTAIENISDARLAGAEMKGGLSNNMQAVMDPLYRKIDALSRFLGLESPEGQAKSLARSGVGSGQLTPREGDALLSELQKQTAIMASDSRKPKLNVDAHTE